MKKFGRRYQLKVQVSEGETVTIEYPLTLEVEIERNTLASANTGRFVVLNLSPDTRRKIFHDRYDTLNFRAVELRAGYEGMDPLPLVFRGNVMWAFSYRRGTEFATEINAFDAGFDILNAQSSRSFAANTNLRDAFRALLGDMAHTTLGAVGTPSEQSRALRGFAAVGNTWDIVNNLTADGEAFVDLGRANLLGPNEYVLGVGGVPLLNSDNGLLNTPRRADASVSVDILFEPRLVVGQIVKLESEEAVNNGVYKVVGVRHSGVISGAVSGRMVTTAGLFQGTARLSGVSGNGIAA